MPNAPSSPNPAKGGGIASIATAIGAALTGQEGWNGTVNGKRGFQKGNKFGARGHHPAVKAAQQAHSKARATAAGYSRRGTANTPRGQAAVTAAAAAHHELEAARKLHESHLPPRDTKAIKTQVERSKGEIREALAGNAHQKLTALKSGAGAGDHDGNSILVHVDRIARGSNKQELFEATRRAGINHDGIETKKALVDHLKTHLYGHKLAGDKSRADAERARVDAEKAKLKPKVEPVKPPASPAPKLKPTPPPAPVKATPPPVPPKIVATPSPTQTPREVFRSAVMRHIDRAQAEIAAAHDRQANVAAAHATPTGFKDALARGRDIADHRAALAHTPHRIAPGPIGDRIAEYHAGPVKAKLISEAHRIHEDEKKRLAQAHDAINAKILEGGKRFDQLAAQAQRSPHNPTHEVELRKAAREVQDLLDTAQEHRTAFEKSDAIFQNHVSAILAVKAPTTIGLVHGVDNRNAATRAAYPIKPQTAAVRAEVEAAAKRIGSIVHAGDKPRIDTPTAMADPKSGSRAYYLDGANRMLVVGQKHPSISAIHELGHHLDDQHGMGARSVEFLNHRVGNEVPQSMRAATGIKAYGPNELGRKDHFDRAFSKVEAFYMGKDYKYATRSEILAMGIEKLHTDPAHFAKHDPEYFHFVTGMLDGSLR